MSRLLIVGETPAINSGFANVLRRLNQYFIDIGHEIEMLGWCHLANMKHDYPYQIHPVDPHKGGYYGQELFDGIVNDFKPDIVFSLGDVYMVEWMIKAKTRNLFTWVSYMPIDSSPMPSFWCSSIDKMDFPVTYSKFGASVIWEQVPSVRDRLSMIYHGIDTNVFYPEDKIAIRQRNGLDLDKFILLYIGVNSSRKQIPRLLEAFDIFARDKEDVTLFMHTSLHHNAGQEGWFLPEILRQHDSIKHKILISKGASPIAGVSESRVRVMYNMSDVFVSATQCEGFGLPFMEAAACKVPSIAVKYSSMPELLGNGRGSLVEASDWICHTPYGMKRPLIDTTKMAKSMSLMYHNKTIKEDMGKKAYDFALGLDWEIVLPQFGNLLEKALDYKNKKTIVDIVPEVSTVMI